MTKQTKLKALAIALSISLAGCGSTMEKTESNPMPHDAYKGAGVFSGKSGNILESFSKDGKKGGTSYQGLPVNVYLWRSSLNAISFMPLASASSQDGVIITDWYVNPNKTNERVKVNVYVLGKAFSATNLKVSMFKQAKKGGEWVNVPASKSTISQLEETILTNARALRIKVNASR